MQIYRTKTARSLNNRYIFTLAVGLLLLTLAATNAFAQLQTSVSSLTGFIQTDAIPCPPQSYLLTGTNISADVVVTAPSGFEISTNLATWVAPPASITVSQNGPTTIPPTTIYVRLNTPTLGVHAGSVSHTSTDSPSLFLPVDGVRSAKSPSVTSLTSDINPSIFGQLVTLTANVTSPLPGTPTGTVSFYDGATILGTTALNGSATATLTTSTLAFGVHDLSAFYNGNSQFDTSSSAAWSQSVRGTTSTIISSNNNPSTFGQTVQFTATVGSGFAGTPTGAVTFYDGASGLGSAFLVAGSAVLSTAALTPGSHSISAAYDGDVFFAGSTSTAMTQTVKALTSTVLGSNHNPSVSGQLVTITASVSSVTPGAITGTVTFLDGGVPVGSPVTIVSGSASIASAYAASASPHHFTATYNGDANYATSGSPTMDQLTNKASTAPVISADHNPSAVGEPVTFTAAITPVAPGGGTPTGTVTFTVDGSPTSPISMIGGSASITRSSLAIGLHTLSASYSGDGDYAVSTSSSYSDTVNPIITATAGLHGSISPPGSVTVLYGSNQIFSIIPAIGYAVDSIFIDGVGKLGAERDTFYNVTMNHTIHATFKIQTQTVTVSAGPNGSASPIGTIIVPRGDSLVVTMLPDPHYRVSDILLDGVSVGAAPVYTLRNIVADHSIDIFFAINEYTLAVNIVGNGTVTKVPDTPIYIHGTTVNLQASPAFGWLFSAWSGDASGSVNPLALLMDGNKNITAAFIEDPAYLVMYRSFHPDSVALDRDNVGKVGKYVKRKSDKVFFKFLLTSPARTQNLSLTLKFGILTSGAITRGLGGAETLYAWSNLKTVVTPALDTGLVFQVEGVGYKGKQVAVSFSWATSPKATKGKVVTYIRNEMKLPMPNRVNALFETFEQGGYAATVGLPVGIAHPENAKAYAWIRAAKYTDVLKTLSDRNGRHNLDNPRVFAYFDNTRPMKGLLKNLPPSKQNNGLAANLMTLRLNIAASQLQKTPPGYGELAYAGTPTAAESSANLFLQGKMIKEIADIGDDIVSGYYVNSTHAGNLPALPVVNDVVRKLNEAFEGVLDTIEFANQLRFTGTRPLIDVPYLRVLPNVPPTILAPLPTPLAQEPEAYALYQNYPNPFNPTTTISFDISDQALVTLRVYNTLGQEVKTLVDNELLDGGTQEYTFDASSLASGVYFYRLVIQGVTEDGDMSEAFTSVKKMILVK